ncbi:SDR family NAD(P)-dependent oxidoreductase [Variovorax sp. RB2P76]|uniref:SDR family NAD(P)-dependent oxidoreductase n=1 Tax=Variovorax sp. RB2P76 TaxID=3443736 RepID=UPI003F48181A
MKPVCLITGAAGLLGRMLCESLASTHDIVAVYHRKMPDIASQLRSRIASNEGNTHTPSAAYCIQADLTVRHDIQRIVEISMARFGRLDVVINSAADIKFHGKLIEAWQTDDYAQHQLSVNCIAPVQLTSAVFENFWKNDPAENEKNNRCVVNVSSVSGLKAFPAAGQAYYAASKSALNMLTLYQSLELAPYGVRANAVCPSRFSDAENGAHVVRGIRRLIDGASSGLIVSDFKD